MSSLLQNCGMQIQADKDAAKKAKADAKVAEKASAKGAKDAEKAAAKQQEEAEKAAAKESKQAAKGAKGGGRGKKVCERANGKASSSGTLSRQHTQPFCWLSDGLLQLTDRQMPTAPTRCARTFAGWQLPWGLELLL